MAKTYDLIVIGSGSGLEVSASVADMGLSVAVVDHGPFGGTCLNRGCIPSKMLIHCADVAETVRTAEKFGVNARVESIDWDFIIRRVYDEIDEESRMILEGNRAAENIDVYTDTARFVREKTLRVGSEEIGAPTIVIAAGTRPGVPDVPGLRDVPYVTSDEALRLPAQPRRIVILGGGFVAAEMAHFFGALGTEIVIVNRSPLLLRAEDHQVSHRFTEVYGRRFDLVLGAKMLRAYRRGDEVAVDVRTPQGERTVGGDVLLVATGCVPNTDLLDVGKTSVAVDARGFVRTDEFLETNVPGVWALGDIVGKYLLKHSANLEAAYAANNIFHPDHKVPVDYHAMPHAVFASPQVAAVGLTEEQAREIGIEYVSAVYDYNKTPYGSSIEDHDGFVKILADPESGELLGCHIIGSHASILIQEAVNLMRSRQTVDAVLRSIYVHPALPEVVQRAFGQLPV